MRSMRNVTQEYVPGLCNIGPAEIRQRRQAGWTGMSVTAVLWFIFILLRVPAPWRLLLFLPASLSATGFLQAAFHFCAGYGMQGVFNLGDQLRAVTRIGNPAARSKDRRKAQRIILLSAVIGVAVALVGYFTA